MRIGVFFNAPEYEGYPFDDEEYVTAYHELARLIIDHGAEFWIVRSQQTYIVHGTFSGGWRFDGTTFQRKEGKVVLDAIFNKGNFLPDPLARIINHPDLEDLCTDKSKTYAAFPQYSPITAVVHSQSELQKGLEKISGTMVVAKPLDLEGGKGVLIDRKEIVAPQITKFPYLLQEFLDTSSGIPGIANGVHDLRLIGVAGALVVAYVREAKPGSWLANVSLGGTIREVPLEQLPKEALAIYEDIDHALATYSDRIFSVDLGRNRDGTWKLIELNSKPGLCPMQQDPGSVRFTTAVADLLVRCAS